MTITAPEQDFDVAVYCKRCGRELDAAFSTRRAEIEVEPCPDCMRVEYVRGREDGREEAKE